MIEYGAALEPRASIVAVPLDEEQVLVTCFSGKRKKYREFSDVISIDAEQGKCKVKRIRPLTNYYVVNGVVTVDQKFVGIGDKWS